MNNKSLIILAAVAVVLGVTAYFLNGGAKSAAPKLNGKAVLPELDASAVAKIEVGGKLVLAAGDKGWTVETYHGYPASREKIAENLLKLGDLKVGQVVRGKALDATTPVVLRDAAGKELANLALGPKHAKWGHGRYAKFEGETVLVSDTLDAFEGDAAKQWIETKVVDEPWISFNDIADAKLTEADFGFKTGVVAKVTVGSDTNRTITVGNVVKGGSDRYMKIAGQDWTYIVPSYSVDKFLPKPPPEPKKEEPKKSEG
jgi:hypothetical protein